MRTLAGPHAVPVLRTSSPGPPDDQEQEMCYDLSTVLLQEEA